MRRAAGRGARKEEKLTEITTIFWDVGGVLLSNGWDRNARTRAVRRFGLDPETFEDRHELVATELEKGRLSLDEYLDCVVFHEARDFGRDDFREFMFRQSTTIDGTLDLAASIRASGRYLMATLNNESKELNHHRIETFGLRRIFDVFFSSCYLGLHKPEIAIYRTAIAMTQRAPEECLMIDDRPLNLESAAKAGLRTLRFRGAAMLEQDLASIGVGAS